MKKVLIDFLLDLNDRGLINNYDFDYEKVAQDFIVDVSKSLPSDIEAGKAMSELSDMADKEAER